MEVTQALHFSWRHFYGFINDRLPIAGRRVDIAMPVSGSIAECMDVVFMKSMSVPHM